MLNKREATAVNETVTKKEAAQANGAHTETHNEWVALLEKNNVIKKGHYLLTSGRHTNRYLQCALLFQHPEDAEAVGRAMAEPFQASDVDVVVGPAVGGIVAAHEVARALGCRALFTERENGKMTFRRGFQLYKGERIVVVEDVVTTGGSVQEVLDVAEQHGAEVLGIASVVDRSTNGSPFRYPFHSLVKIQVETYTSEQCPLCAAGAEPPIKPGSRKTS